MKFSVIIPSYNQEPFIERTIQSVLNQAGDFYIEFAVIDGGSSDTTAVTLSKYKTILDDKTSASVCQGIDFTWVSEKDDGQADAVNKGISRTSGEIIAWINSDDIYYPGAFESVRRMFEEKPDVDVVYGLCNHIDEHDGVIEPYPTEPWDYARLFETCYICQPGVFFRRKLVDLHGTLDASLRYCMDYELWLRFGKSAGFHYLERLLAGSRIYETNKTMGQRVAVHYEINDMFHEKFGQVPRTWIYNFAGVIAQEEKKRLHKTHVDEDRVRELAQDAFLKWWGCIPKKELSYLDLYISNPRTKSWPIKRELKGLDKLRIGFDVSQTFPGYAGCGQVAQSLLKTMVDQFPKDVFIAYTTFGPFCCCGSLAQSIPRIYGQNVYYALSDLNDEEARNFWSDIPDYAMASIGCPDVIHANNFFCPEIPNTKIVYTLYDLSFIEHREFTSRENAMVCKQGLDTAAKHADMIIAISDYSRNRFLHHYPAFPASRIRTVHLASRFGPDLESTPIPELTPGKYWLSVATLEQKKNSRNLLKAYKIYAHDRADVPPLVLVGGQGWLEEDLPKFIETLGLEWHVRVLGYRNDSELKWLYENCFAFCYPSLYEGFGLPVLEAMSLGAPVISSNTTSLPKAARDAALSVDPTDVEDIARALDILHTNTSLRSDLKRKSTIQAGKFSWAETAKQVHEVYSETLNLPKKQNTETRADKFERPFLAHIPAGTRIERSVCGTQGQQDAGYDVIHRMRNPGIVECIIGACSRALQKHPGMTDRLKRTKCGNKLMGLKTVIRKKV